MNIKIFKKKDKSSTKITSLIKWNKWIAVLFAVQGFLLLIFNSKSSQWPIVTSYNTEDTVASKISDTSVISSASHAMFNINIVYILVVYFFVFALFNILAITKYRRLYESQLAKGVNKIKWADSVLCSGTLITVVAVVCGVRDFSVLLSLFWFNVVSSVLGWYVEFKKQDSKQINKPIFIVGMLASIASWMIISIHMIGSMIYGRGAVTTVVYYIYILASVLLFNSLLSTYLHISKNSRWTDYVCAEKINLTVGLIAKIALVWLIFFDALR